MMKAEGAFPRLVELTKSIDAADHKDMHRLLLQLLYEMSRIQRLTWEDLCKSTKCAANILLIHQPSSTTLSYFTFSKSSRNYTTTPTTRTRTTSFESL